MVAASEIQAPPHQLTEKKKTQGKVTESHWMEEQIQGLSEAKAKLILPLQR